MSYLRMWCDALFSRMFICGFWGNYHICIIYFLEHFASSHYTYTSIGVMNLNKHLRLQKNKPLTEVWSSGTPTFDNALYLTHRAPDRKYLEVTLKLKNLTKSLNLNDSVLKQKIWIKYWYYLVDTEKISIKTKVSIILIIQFLIFKHFLKTNTHARKYYWSVLCTEHKDGEKFILRAHLCGQVKSRIFQDKA